MSKQFTITLNFEQEPFPVEQQSGIPKNLKVVKESFTFSFEGDFNIDRVSEIVAKALWGKDKIYILTYANE